MMRRNTSLEPKWLLTIVFFIAGGFLGGLLIYLWLNVSRPVLQRIHGNANYKYINPLLAVDTYENHKFGQNKTLELRYQGLINQAKSEGKILDAAVYFRDIEPGVWVGIDESSRFSPGRLLKIPIMIAYYKLAESRPDILSETVGVMNVSPKGDGEIYGSPTLVQDRESYTVDELIHRMVTGYDTNAALALFDFIDKSSLNEVFSDLGISFKEDRDTPDYISLKAYSLFFRVLYNATYLNRQYSETALELLSAPENEDKGLAAGLQRNIPVAHRPGAHVLPDGKTIEMYDCSINYYPSHPYLLCVLGHGHSLSDLKEFFSQLTQATFTEVDYQYHSSYPQ